MNEDSLWTGDDNVKMTHGGYGDYQTLGNLLVALPSHKSNSNYRRELDIGDSISRVEYQSNGVHYKREYFASHLADVLVGHLSADKPKGYTGHIELQDAHKGHIMATNNDITITGQLSNGLKYSWQVLVLHSGGSLQQKGSTLEFKDCDSLTLMLGAGTNYAMDSTKKYRGEGPDTKVKPKTKSASTVTYEKLREDHINDFHSLFNRVDLDLGQSSANQKSMTTNKRKVQAVDHFDPDFEELFFQFGRYLMISSSRGYLPANLQVHFIIHLVSNGQRGGRGSNN